METGMAGKYSIQVRYEQHLTLFSSQNTQGTQGRTVSTSTLTASRTFAFTLEIQTKSAGQLPEQARIATLGRGSRMKGNKPAGAGQPPKPRTPEEAAEMVGEQGYWGVKKTAARLSEFVIKGAGDDLDRLRAGRAGIIQGFKEAEAIFGGNLPKISHQTLEAALAAIDERIRNLDGSVVDTAA
jgi:hypothetical protein